MSESIQDRKNNIKKKKKAKKKAEIDGKVWFHYI